MARSTTPPPAICGGWRTRLASDELRVALGSGSQFADAVPSLVFAVVATTEWQAIGADSGSGDVRRQRPHG